MIHWNHGIKTTRNGFFQFQSTEEISPSVTQTTSSVQSIDPLPGRQAFWTYPINLLRVAKCIESFTEATLMSNARVIQLAPSEFQPARIRPNLDGNWTGSR